MTDNFSTMAQQLFCYPIDMMKFVFALLVCAFLTTALNLPTFMAEIAHSAQESCRSFFHKPLESSQIVETYLCGADLPEGPIREVFIQTSLYHLIVVSGSHLTFLLLILDMLGCQNSIVQFLVGVSLALVTGFRPPILRAIFQQIAKMASQFFRWHWRGAQELILGSFLTLGFVPLWISSLSFQLSLGAVLGLRLGKLLNVGRFKEAVIIYLCLLPLLWGWAQLSPLGILTNLFIAPFLSLLLWILCGVWIFSPDLATTGFGVCLKGLNFLGPLMPLPDPGPSLQAAFRWLYILLLIGTLWFLQIHRERSR